MTSRSTLGAHRRGKLLLALVLGAATACGSGDRSALTRQPVEPAPNSAILLRHSQREAANAQITPAQFLAQNPFGWVGTAHNRGLALFFTRIGQRPSVSPCELLKQIVRGDNMLGPDRSRVTASEWKRSAEQAIASNRLCGTAKSASTPAGRSDGQRASIFKHAAWATPKYDAQYFLDAIDAAVDQAGSPSGYSSAVSAIVSAASSELSGTDMDNVNAVASVAVGSYSYWDSNINSDASAYSSSYGASCQQATDPSQCVYAMSFRAPAGRSSALAFRRVANKAPFCTYALNGREMGVSFS